MGSKYSFLSEILKENNEFLEEIDVYVERVLRIRCSLRGSMGLADGNSLHEEKLSEMKGLSGEDEEFADGNSLHEEKPLEKSNLFKFSRNPENGKIIGIDLNVFSIVLASQLMNGRGYVICSPAELQDAVKGRRISFEGKIVDAGLILSGEASPNEGQSRAFGEEIRKKREVIKSKKLKYPFVIPLGSLEVIRDEVGSKFDGILLRIKKGAKIIDASQSTLQYPHGQYPNVGYFDETDGNGLPKVNGTGWRKLENRLGGTLRLCLIDGRDFKTLGDFVSYDIKLDAVFRYQC